MLVMKFGGTSVADREAIHRVCSIVYDSAHRDPLVVVSAMGKTTDELERAAQAEPDQARLLLSTLRESTATTARAVVPEEGLSDVLAVLDGIFDEAAALIVSLPNGSARSQPSAGLDALLACGERISSYLVTWALRGHGLDAAHLDARPLFVTDARHGGANPMIGATRERLTAAVPAVLATGAIPVMGGFIATGDDGSPTTLGRGGSDLTASLAGAALGAEEVQIWTDVDGVMTADPTLIESAQPLPALSLLEAAELAYFGGRVLHPSTMLPAIDHGIPLRVLNSLRPQAEGTLIVKEPAERESVVKSIVYKENITLIDIHSTRMLMAHGFLAKIFAIFERHETAVDMVSTSEVSVSLTVDRADKLQAILADLADFADAEATPGKAIICVVGEGIRYTLGIAAKVFHALEGIRIRMISLGASRVNVSFVVDEEHVEMAVRRMHGAFFPQAAGTQGESQ